jgi:GDP-D-mannose 3', 5'-epimerase
VRIARFHNIFGPEGTWYGGREKAPAALCRKVAEAANGGRIEIWGDGRQTRSFLYIDECLEAVRRLMRSDFTGPINVGSQEMISINEFARMVIRISGKTLAIKNIDGPIGVRAKDLRQRAHSHGAGVDTVHAAGRRHAPDLFLDSRAGKARGAR